MMQLVNEADNYDPYSSPDISGLDPSLGAGLDEIPIGVLPDGTFVVTKNGQAVPVGPALQRELEREQKRQENYKKAIKQGQTPEQIKQNNDKRFQFNGQNHKIDDDNRFNKDPSREPYYKQTADDDLKELFDRGYFEGSDVSAMTKTLKVMMEHFLNNQIRDDDDDVYKIRIDKSYLRPDRRLVLSDDSTAKGRRRVHYRPDDDEEEEEDEVERPMALVYLDCSGSFGTEQKTQLGKDIIALLGTYKNDRGTPLLDLDVNFFAGEVSKTIDGTGGGTNLRKVLNDIRTKTAGKIANVVIITDSDADAYADEPPVVINGSVWLIYCCDAAPNFGKTFRLEGRDSVFEEFFFTKIK